MDTKLTQQPAPNTIYGRAPLWLLFDVAIVCGTLGLGICYVWARYLGHVDVFCSISSLVEHLPERVHGALHRALCAHVDTKPMEYERI